jgi:hypothetical protein
MVQSAVPAYEEGFGGDWYYADASYGGYRLSVPLVIKINGDPTDWQAFNLGETVRITVDLRAYASSCARWGNEAYTIATLEVVARAAWVPIPPGIDMTGATPFVQRWTLSRDSRSRIL